MQKNEKDRLVKKGDTTAESARSSERLIQTGWSALVSQDGLVQIIDSLLDLPPSKEFNITELSEIADVSRPTVHAHKETLLALDVLEKVPETSPQRYQFNPESEVSEAFITLDGAISSYQAGWRD